MLGIKTNIPEIKDKLRRIQELIDSGWQDEIVQIAEDATELITQLTPRGDSSYDVSKGGKIKQKKHLADGWTLKKIGGSAKSREPLLLVIYNKLTHSPTGEPKSGALMETASGKKDYTLLEIVEYGTGPHVIEPYEKDFLAFPGDGGKMIFSKRVHHPGTPAVGMIRLTRAKVREWLKDFKKRWLSNVEKEWTE